MGVNLWVQSKNVLPIADMISPATTFFFDPLYIAKRQNACESVAVSACDGVL
jgi:hypothetical protein